MEKSEIIEAIDLLRCRFSGCNFEEISEHRDAVESAISALNNLLLGSGCRTARSRDYARFLRRQLEAHLGAVILMREELQVEAAQHAAAASNIPAYSMRSPLG